MLKIVTAFMMLAVSATPFPALSAEEPSTWAGTYTYDDNGGKTIGGSGENIGYKLTLDPSSSKIPCILSVSGYQTDDQILCGVIAKQASVDVTFKTFGDGRIVNKYDVRVYEPGDILFTLTKPKKQIVTRWNKLTPSGKPSKGSYFKKAKD